MRVKDVPLEVFLGMIKSETGWEVKVEPGLQQIVSGKFRNKPAADAIRLMLGRVRFAFLPRLEGGTRLLVYAGNTRSATQSVVAVEQAAADDENPDEALIHLPVKIHYLRSRYVSINADTKLTNLRPLFAGPMKSGDREKCDLPQGGQSNCYRRMWQRKRSLPICSSRVCPQRMCACINPVFYIG